MKLVMPDIAPQVEEGLWVTIGALITLAIDMCGDLALAMLYIADRTP
jgi:hypothetical protein